MNNGYEDDNDNDVAVDEITEAVDDETDTVVMGSSAAHCCGECRDIRDLHSLFLSSSWFSSSSSVLVKLEWKNTKIITI